MPAHDMRLLAHLIFKSVLRCAVHMPARREDVAVTVKCEAATEQALVRLDGPPVMRIADVEDDSAATVTRQWVGGLGQLQKQEAACRVCMIATNGHVCTCKATFGYYVWLQRTNHYLCSIAK
jgi:hypothetical protein